MHFRNASLPLVLAALTLTIAKTAAAAPAATYDGIHGSDTVPYWGPGAGQDNIGYAFNGSTGFYFVPTESIEISALGLMDFAAPGLQGEHTVAIYENVVSNVVPCVGCTMPRLTTGDLVAEIDIDAGMSGDFTSGWGRYVELPSSVVLVPGVEYYIVADNLGCDPAAFQWFGYCGGADNSDQDMSVFGSTAVTFDPRLTWTGYAGAYDVATGEQWDLDESYQVPPSLGVNGNIGPVFWIEEPECTYAAADWIALDEWPVDSLEYGGTTFGHAAIVEYIGRRNATAPTVLLWQALIVTDLNLANGVDGGEIETTRDSAESLALQMLHPIPGVNYTATAYGLYQTLMAWNLGATGPGACEPVHCP